MALNRNAVPETSRDAANGTPEGASPAENATKKAFVEPMISVPADVLEATAFFQPPSAATGDTDGVD